MDPEEHCAINLALHHHDGDAWVFSEVPRRAVDRSASSLQLGRSILRWQGDTLVIDIDERTAPWGARVRGQIRFHPEALFGQAFALDGEDRHRWWPVAPLGRVEVVLEQPRLRFIGDGYHDHNFGLEPLEDAFEGWSWSRATMADRSIVLYDARTRTEGYERAADSFELGLSFSARGEVTPLEAPRHVELAPARWGMTRTTRVDRRGDVQLLRTLEDSPFYSRSLLYTTLDGHGAHAIHESLSLSRFVHPIVQRLLPFRIRRTR